VGKTVLGKDRTAFCKQLLLSAYYNLPLTGLHLFNQ